MIPVLIAFVESREKIKFNPENIAPSKMLKNAKNVFNPFEPRNLVEFVKSLIKLVVVFVCGYSAVSGRKDELFALLGQNVDNSFAVVGSILGQMLINICLAMLLIGLIDKKYQDYDITNL